MLHLPHEPSGCKVDGQVQRCNGDNRCTPSTRHAARETSQRSGKSRRTGMEAGAVPYFLFSECKTASQAAWQLTDFRPGPAASKKGRTPCFRLPPRRLSPVSCMSGLGLARGRGCADQNKRWYPHEPARLAVNRALHSPFSAARPCRCCKLTSLRLIGIFSRRARGQQGNKDVRDEICYETQVPWNITIFRYRAVVLKCTYTYIGRARGRGRDVRVRLT